MGIYPGELKVYDFFDASYVYDIPSYQRDYKWGSKEVETLINDLIEFKNQQTKKPETVYYMGNIIRQGTAPGTQESSDCDFYLIDGQQRLTTFFILYKYIIDKKIEFKKMDISSKDAYDSKFYIKEKQKMKLFNHNNDLFEFIYNTNKAKKNYENNYKTICNKLDQIVNADNIVSWEAMFKSVVFGLISVTLDQNAEFIFESINSKGKELTLSEKLKNKFLLKNNLLMKESILNDQTLIEDVSEKNKKLELKIINTFEEIEKYQSDIENKSSNVKLIHFKNPFEFLRSIMTYILRKEIPNNSDDSFNLIKTKIDTILTLEELDKLIDEIDEVIMKISMIISIMSNPSDVSYYINWIQMKSTSFITLLIDSITKERIEKIKVLDHTDLIQPIKNIFTLIVKTSILTDGFSGINIWKYIPEVIIGEEDISLLEEKFAKAFLKNDDDEIEIEIKEINITLDDLKTYDFYKMDKHLTKHLLFLVERKYQTDKFESETEVWDQTLRRVNDSNWTIEHIIPQKINPADSKGKIWIEELGQEFDYFSNLNRIGNLTLVTRWMNSAAKNNTFAVKKEHYSKSNLLINEELNENEFFSGETFKYRNNNLINICKEILEL